MSPSRYHLMFASAMALVVAAPLAAIGADDNATVKTNPSFNPDTGQINSGVTEQAPSWSTQIIRIPSPEEARAAFLEPISTQPSLGSGQINTIPKAEAPQHSDGATQKESKNVVGGPQGSGANANNPQWGTEAIGGQGGGGTTSTSGSGGMQNTTSNSAQPQGTQQSANREPPPSGPIGAIGQTMPAKFSKRNDILDRVPIMAYPLGLSDADRKNIYDAVMADKSPAVAGAESLVPASELSTDQALNGMHPLPDSLSGINQVQRFKYVKSKDKVLLVEPATRVVVDQIKS